MINYGNRIFKTGRLFNTKFIFRKGGRLRQNWQIWNLRLYFIVQNKQAIYETLLMADKLAHHFFLFNILLSISKTIDLALFILFIWL